MRLTARLFRRARTQPVPDSITNLEATNLEPSHFRRRSMLGHRIELNPELPHKLAELIPTLTSAVMDTPNPTPFNALLGVELPPSVLPSVGAHLAELDSSTPEYKMSPHWRIHDLQRAYGVDPRG